VSPRSATFRRVPFHLLNAEPVPVWYVEEGHKPSLDDEPILALYRALQPVNGKGWITFRGVPIDRLRAVVDNGVDVFPTDTTIFCADEDKAYEYARPQSGCDGPGLMYALRMTCERRRSTVPTRVAMCTRLATRPLASYQRAGPIRDG
jgi:hypothetical protein